MMLCYEPDKRMSPKRAPSLIRSSKTPNPAKLNCATITFPNMKTVHRPDLEIFMRTYTEENYSTASDVNTEAH